MAEDEGDKSVMAREVNLEEMMEVVTSYKCRFCDFTVSDAQTMTKHLQSIHMANIPKSSAGLVAVQDPQADSAQILKTAAVPRDEGEIQDAENETQTSFEAPTLLSNLGLAPNQRSGSPSLIVQPVLPDPKVLTNQVRSVARNLTIINCQPDMGLFPLSGTQAQKLPSLIKYKVAGPNLTLSTASTTMDSISVSLADSSKDLGTGPSSIASITRDLYLCGVCSLGFTSVDDCKQHMAKEHSAPVENANVSDTVVDKFEQRVSVGTQVTGKRPGRKRKSEMAAPVVSPEPQSKKKCPADEEDEDWYPGHSLSTGTREGKPRRKIRTPKALKEDYVIEKKRKYRKRIMTVKESYTLACSFMGCSTKFRCEESLNLHLDCHNKADDAFTCIHCSTAFEAWKPLRIHLWRSHKVDCDMFQCDKCNYKTDTLHKLGIHREIHSENRPYTCDVCGKGFKQLSQMKNHQLIHSEHQNTGRETWFTNKTCDICKRSFANSKCLRKHVEAVHMENKPFQCQYCSHSTAWKAMLILHERKHTGEKPFKCDVCSFTTGDHNSLRRHKMRHTGQRQYKCQLCNYSCIQSISLKTHMRNKHPNAQGFVYMCQLCKFRTINRQIYENHMEDHRNGLVPESKMESAPVKQTSASLNANTAAAAVAGNSLTLIPESPVQYQLQVNRMDTGELHANKEDIDKLNIMPEIVNSGVDANQLIYSALNIGTQVDGMVYTVQLLNGVHTTVSPAAVAGKGVQASYLMTFHSPQSTGQPQVSTSGQTVVYQSLAEQEVAGVEPTASQDEASEVGVTQGVEADTECPMTLAEASQAQNLEHVTQILYTQVPQVMEAATHIPSDHQTLSVSDAQPGTEFHVMHVTSAEAGDPEKLDAVAGGDDFGGAHAVVVSQEGHIMEGMDSVLLAEGGRSIMVMEGGEMMERVLVMAADTDQANMAADYTEHAANHVTAESDNTDVQTVVESFTVGEMAEVQDPGNVVDHGQQNR